MSKVKKIYYLNGIKTNKKPEAKLIGRVKGFIKTKEGKIKPYKEDHYI